MTPVKINVGNSPHLKQNMTIFHSHDSLTHTDCSLYSSNSNPHAVTDTKFKLLDKYQYMENLRLRFCSFYISMSSNSRAHPQQRLRKPAVITEQYFYDLTMNENMSNEAC